MLHARIGVGPPVVLVHGTAADLWGPLPEALVVAGFSVVRYDRRGFGASSLPPVSDLSVHAADLRELLGEVGPAVVVGWSLGGVVALEAASAARGLVLIEPPFRTASSPPSLGGAWAYLRTLGLAALGREVAAGRTFVGWALGPEASLLTAADRAAIDANAPAILAELRARTGEHLPADALSSLRLPVRVLLGDRSDPSLAAAAARVVAAVPGAVLERASGAGHLLAASRPEVVVDAVAAVAREAGLR